jgi:hypothetical protein
MGGKRPPLPTRFFGCTIDAPAKHERLSLFLNGNKGH